MERVLVMGSSGSGKSTFARRLSALTGIPMVSLDALYYRQRQRPKLLKYFEGLRPDHAFVCFTRRAQAEHYLTDVASTSIQASVH